MSNSSQDHSHNATLNDLRRFIERHQVAVVAHDNEKIIEQGSGILIQHKERYLILTAAHVVDGSSPDAIQLIHSKCPSDSKTPIRKIESLGGGWNEPNDVAYLEINKETAYELTDRSFLSVDQIRIEMSLEGNESLLVSGMPGAEDYTRVEKLNSLNSYSYIPLLFAANSRPPESWHGSTNNEYEYEIEWPFEAMDYLTKSRVHLPNPKGMSGGGLWKVDRPLSTIAKSDWPKFISLIGINTTFIEEHEYIRSEKLDSIYFLSELYN